MLAFPLWTSLALAASAAPPACEPVEGLDPLLSSGTVLLLGEMHGTEQSVRFVSRASCLALGKGLSVTVALELPRKEEAALTAFLASEGSAADRAAFLEGSPFWSDRQDGRTSEAMLALLDDLRRFRRAGRPLRVTWIDSPFDPQRDRLMAERLGEAIAGAPKDLFLVLTGNLHNRLNRSTPWGQEKEWMGYHLLQRRPAARLVSLDYAYSGGEAWACIKQKPEDPEECRVWPMGGKDRGPKPFVEARETMDERGHHGFYYVGALTASAPAIPRGKAVGRGRRSP